MRLQPLPHPIDLTRAGEAERSFTTTQFSSENRSRYAVRQANQGATELDPEKRTPRRLKSGPDRKYTVEFREAAVKQVLDGKHSVRQAALALEISYKTLANWVAKAKKGQPLIKRARQPKR